jgi:hypothetical protein
MSNNLFIISGCLFEIRIYVFSFDKLIDDVFIDYFVFQLNSLIIDGNKLYM